MRFDTSPDILAHLLVCVLSRARPVLHAWSLGVGVTVPYRTVWPERVGKRGSWERGSRGSLCGRAWQSRGRVSSRGSHVASSALVAVTWP
eukprot:1164063-Prymnesium_polylepis.1